MDIFDKISDVASKTYEITSNKTCKIAKETKLRFNMNECKSKIYDLYEELGKDLYEIHLLKDNDDEESKTEIKIIREEIERYLIDIDSLGDNIEYFKQELLKIREKKKCNNCHKEINIEVRYCPYCGSKQKNEKEDNVKEDEKIGNIYNNDDNNKESISNEQKNKIDESNITKDDKKLNEENIKNKKKILINDPSTINDNTIILPKNINSINLNSNYDSQDNDNKKDNENNNNNELDLNSNTDKDNDNKSNSNNNDETNIEKNSNSNIGINKDKTSTLYNMNLADKIKNEIDSEMYKYNNELNKNNKQNFKNKNNDKK